jgi:uncharacterized protein involved in outer membrane biogenesis
MKFLKIVGAVFGGIVTLLIAAAIVLYLTFDPNDYKDYLADWVTERTGRTFAIDDDLELTFFPWLGVTTGNVSLGNRAEFGNEPFAAIDELTVSVQLLPLLRRQVEIGTVRLDGLELNLATTEDGVNNWSDLLSSGESVSSGDSSDAAAEPFLQSLNIAGIDINNGVMFWRENTTDVRYVISELSADTGAISPGRAVEGELGFRLVSVDPQLSADVGITGTIAIAAGDAAVAADDVRVTFNLADGRGNERAAGSLALTQASVAATTGEIALSNGNLTAALIEPPLGPAETEVQLNWSTAVFDRDSETLTIDGLAAAAAGLTAQLELAGKAMLTAPELAGTIRVLDQPLVAFVDAAALELAEGARESLGSVSADARFSVLVDTQEIAVRDATLNALGVTATGTADIAADRSISARLDTAPFDPARLVVLLPETTREQVDVAAIGQVAVSTNIELAAATETLTLSDLVIDAFETQLTGTVTRRDAGQRLNGNITVAALNANRLAAVLGDAFPDAVSPAALGTIALSTTFDYAPEARTLSLDDLEARAADVDLAGAIRVTDVGGSPAWVGDIEVPTFDPEALLSRLERPLSARRDATTLGRARGSAHIEGDASRISAENLRLVLDDSTISGDVTVTLADLTAYAFDLTIDQLDADRYLPPADEAQPEGVGPTAADIALPTEPLRRLQLDGRFSVGDLRVAGMALENVGATLTADNGHGIVDDVRATLYGGEFQGRVELDASSEDARLVLDGTMTTLELEPLLAALRGEANMTGTGNFDLTLAGTGNALSNVLDTAQGRVSFSVSEGLLRGFDLGRTMCSAFNATQRLQRPPAAAEPVTRYTLMRGSANVLEGIAQTEDLEATTSFLQVTGRGQSDLVSRELNYDLVATLTDNITIERCESMDRLIGDSVPVRVTGTILEPEIAPDYGEILRNRVRDELQDRLRERLFN